MKERRTVYLYAADEQWLDQQIKRPEISSKSQAIRNAIAYYRQHRSTADEVVADD